jgi:hypothetical protein
MQRRTKVEIVGESILLCLKHYIIYFRTGMNALDAIIGIFCRVDFIYSTLKTAMANGTCLQLQNMQQVF